MIKVAVLLASYNGVKYIEEQLNSILSQYRVQVVIFISDDFSADETIRFVKDKFSRFENIRFLPNISKFGGAGKNFYRLIRDVDFSDFDYISFADQDDIWNLDKLESATNTIKGNKVSAYSSNVLAFWGDGKELLLDKAQPQKKYDYLFEAAGPGCTYVLNKDLALALQYFVKEHWDAVNAIELHDWFMYAFARSNGYKWFIDPKPSMRYRQHGKNQVGANTGFQAKKVRLKKVLSSWYRDEIIKIVKIFDCQSKLPFSNMLLHKSWLNNIRLACYAFQFRRKNSEALFLAVLFLLNIF